MHGVLTVALLLGLLWCGAARGVVLQYQFSPAVENVYAGTLAMQSTDRSGINVRTGLTILQGASVRRGVTTLINRQEAVTGRNRQQLIMLTDVTPQGRMTNLRIQRITSRGWSQPAAPLGLRPGSVIVSPFGETLLFPSRNLNFGDSWTETGPMQVQDIFSASVLTGAYNIIYTLKGNAIIDGKACYLITSKFTITCPRQAGLAVSLISSGAGTFYFDLRLGDVRQVKTSAHISYRRYRPNRRAEKMEIDAGYALRLAKSRTK